MKTKQQEFFFVSSFVRLLAYALTMILCLCSRVNQALTIRRTILRVVRRFLLILIKLAKKLRFLLKRVFVYLSDGEWRVRIYKQWLLQRDMKTILYSFNFLFLRMNANQAKDKNMLLGKAVRLMPLFST